MQPANIFETTFLHCRVVRAAEARRWTLQPSWHGKLMSFQTSLLQMGTEIPRREQHSWTEFLKH